MGKKYLCDASPKMSAEITAEITNFDNSTLCGVLESKPMVRRCRLTLSNPR